MSWLRAAVLFGVTAALVFCDFVIVPVLMGTLIALALAPAVTLLARRGVPRGLAAIVPLAALIAVVAGTVAAVREPLQAVAEQAPRMIQIARKHVQDLEAGLAVPAGRRADATNAGGPALIQTLGPVAASITRSALALAVSMVLAYFLLTYGPGVGRALLVAIQGKRDRRRWLRVCSAIRQQTANYLQTVSLINVSFGLLTFTILTLLGQSNAGAYAVLSGLLNFIPFIGALAATLLITAGAVADHGVHGSALIPPAAFLLLHVIESQLVTPLLLGRRLILNPLIVVLGILVGSAAWGLGGAFIAVPTLTALKLAADAHPGWRRWGQVLGRGALADELTPGVHRHIVRRL